MTPKEALSQKLRIIDNVERWSPLSYEDAHALDMAFDYLLASIPRIMTFDEVKQDMPRLLWCEEVGNGNRTIYPAIAWESHLVNHTDFIMFTEHGFEGNYGAKPLYNKTWRCWTHKPSEEQMNAEKLL